MINDALRLKITRKVNDGRPCASAFISNGITYTDCTTSITPDGSQTGVEWCYTDPNAGGSPNWGFCDKVMNFDKVREKTKEMLKEITPEIRKVNQQMLEKLDILNKFMQLINDVKIQQGKEDLQFQQVSQLVQQINDDYGQLEKLKQQWEYLQGLVVKDKQIIAELSKNNQFDRKDYCEGIIGYEQEKDGDGIVGTYYNNEDFKGEEHIINDEKIDFEWIDEAPIPQVNEENFSVKWEGYLKAPITSNYRFRIDTDDGGALYINQQMIISKKMGTDTESQQGYKSGDIFLIGGNKYQIKYLCYHSVHNSFKEEQNMFTKLYWSSDEFQEQIVNERYFYKTNRAPPLKATNYTHNQMMLKTFRDFDYAFLDKPNLILADIPLQFQGLQQLRLNSIINDKVLSFKSTQPIIVMIGFNKKGQNPLGSDWLDTGEVLSVLQISKSSKIQTQSSSIRAQVSIAFAIYKKKFPAGVISIPLTYTESQPSTSLVMFYMANNQELDNISCGGQQINLSLNTGVAFKTCSASSTLDELKYGCKFAFSGKMIDQPNGIWVSKGEGAGAWIQIEFNGKYQITAIEFKNRESSAERNREIEINFSGGQKQIIQLRNSDNPIIMTVDGIIASSIKFSINSVYSQLNNGLGINIFGVPCESHNIDVKKTIDDIVKLNCFDSLTSKDELINAKLVKGDTFQAFCSEACVNEKVDIFGSMIYSEDSPFCKSAYHAGTIKNGGQFQVVIEKGQNTYIQELRNGITSLSKQGQDSVGRSVSFKAIEDQKVKLINLAFLGMQVDVLDEKISKKKQWLPGNIITINRISHQICEIEVKLEGYESQFNLKMQWPDERVVDFCGEKITERECDPKSKKQRDSNDIEVKFCFSPNQKCPQGYIIDRGNIFSKQNELQYGWTRDMTKMTRSRGNNQDELLDNLILFPPDPQSQWCANPKTTIGCEVASWKIAIPNGKYEVKLTCGDPSYNSGYSIKINNQYIIKNRILQRNSFFTDTIEVDVEQKEIIVSSICPTDEENKSCQNIWSRMNAIEIKKINIKKQDLKDKNFDVQGTKSLGCGNSYVEGRCLQKEVENCIFEDTVSQQSISNCQGNLALVVIPPSFQCKDQIGKLKCIKMTYETPDECIKSCPGKCLGLQCKVTLKVPN